MSASPVLSWKRDPPEAGEEARAARLLRAVAPPPALDAETVERVGRRVRKTALRRRARLAFETELASIAAALAMAGILAALAWLVMDLTTR
jgi:hypothetical protein